MEVPVKKSASNVYHTETNGGDTVNLTGGNVEDIEIKIEDKVEGKIAVAESLPSIGSSKTCTEFVEEDTGLVHTSVTMFFSPITDIHISSCPTPGSTFLHMFWDPSRICNRIFVLSEDHA